MPAVIVLDAKSSVLVPPSPSSHIAGRPQGTGETVIVLADGRLAMVNHDDVYCDNLPSALPPESSMPQVFTFETTDKSL